MTASVPVPRIVVLIDWAAAYSSRQRYARVIADIGAGPAATGRSSSGRPARALGVQP